MAMPLKEYAEKVGGLVFAQAPGESMRAHSAGWRGVLHDIRWAGNPGKVSDGGGIYEVASIVVSRWEYLGGLYRGTIGGTGEADAHVYATRFLRQYDKVHNLSGKPCQSNERRSDFFRMFRNKPLHGFTPAGIMKHGKADEVLGWSVGANPSHLLVDRAIHVDCEKLYEDLCDSMLEFADCLDANSDRIEGKPHFPQDRWKRGVWDTFCPEGIEPNRWLKIGTDTCGIPK